MLAVNRLRRRQSGESERTRCVVYAHEEAIPRSCGWPINGRTEDWGRICLLERWPAQRRLK